MPASLQEIVGEHRLFHRLHRELAGARSTSRWLLDTLLGYIDRYARRRGLCPLEVTAAYEKFITRYNQDLKAFSRTGKYPCETGPPRAEFTRTEYDLALLLSTVLTPHRFRIMELVQLTGGTGGRALVLGCGAGVEVELIKPGFDEVIASDVEIGEACRALHHDVSFHPEALRPGDRSRFDRIYLVELLEHVSDPYVLLERAARGLRETGSIVLTTATNLPQFDHLHNFPADHRQFEMQVRELGLAVTFREEIPHRYLIADVGAKNDFFVLRPSHTDTLP